MVITVKPITCSKCKIDMDWLPLSNAWRCHKCGRIVRYR